jgi:acyl-coenzyme A synthetase/AMP-(fatty) acid ligase
LARFKALSAVVFVDDLPGTATGKVQKFQLREQFQSALTAPADPER